MDLSIPQDTRLAAVGLDYLDGHHVQPHDHPQAQLLYAASGLMRLVTRQGAWIIPPTRAVWIPPGIRHEIHMSGEVHMRTLFIRADACPENLQGCCVLAVTPLLREMILRCIRWQAQPGEAALPLLEQLILLEIATLERLPLALPLPTDRRLQAICKSLLKNPEHPHTLEDWGQQVGASSRTLARLFRQELGMSYQEWRQQLRLTEALPRLLAGESVQSVAAALGYTSGRAFSAMFRRLVGENPREYLQALAQLAELKV